MAYVVTATRRRPRRFEDMFGQDFVVATLQKSIQAGKIAPAYLFSGPRGCGKTTSARLLAKSINCANGPTGTPCGTCPACEEIARGSSLDVIEIDGASNTSVNDVRQIKDEVLFPPNSCRYKVYIIDEVHMLSTSAFNALLKTIEEPPPYVVFIFATTELHKVPATIKSRCQQFNFRLVSVDLLKGALSDAAAELGIEAEDEALYWIAREATGSPRDAYTLFDQVTAFSDGHITFDKIRDKLGLVGVDRINPLAESCVAGNAAQAIEMLDGILQSGVSVEQFTVDLAEYFRSLLFVKSGIRKEALLGQSPERYSQTVLETWSAVQLERALGVALQLFRDIRYSLNPRYELELAVSRLSWLGEYVSPAELKKAIAGAKTLLERGASGPFPEADRRTLISRPAREPESEPYRETGTEGRAHAVPSAETQGYDEMRNEPERESEPVDDDALVQDPFAALKARMGMGRPLAAPAASAAPTVTAASNGAGIEEVPFEAAGTREPSYRQESPSGADEVPAAGNTAVPEIDEFSLPVDSSRPVEMTLAPAAPDSSAPADSAEAENSNFEALSASPQIPFEELQEALVTTFQATKNMVATGIKQAFDWTDAGAVIRFSVDKPFVHNFLEQEHKAIAAEASRLLGRQVALEISMDQSRAGAAEESEAIPGEIEVVRQMFRGTIQK